MKQLFLSIFFIFSVLNISAQSKQNSDSCYVRPLVDVLSDIEKQFGVTIKYDQKMLNGKDLSYADWRIRPWSVEETLTAVLSPFDLVYVMDKTKYKIKNFEYPRNNQAYGKQFLAYLESLYSDKELWEMRREDLKECLPQALKLDKLFKSRSSAKPILSNKRNYDGYSVENFALETLPGLYVCGSIYYPKKIKGKLPVVLNPNGHFWQGRYRADQQKRCATQARLGMIAVSWDLFAWGESLLQFDEADHRLSVAQSIQTFNALCILDYMLLSKNADTSRVAVTGGSGGGSMTMLLSAIDDRIDVSIPTVMLASHFSGGCPCESGMPTHLCGNRTNNAEIAAMFAPKPQLIISDGKDWSSSVPNLEYPFIKRIYSFYNESQNVNNSHFTDEGHDYGFSKRNVMYKFLASHFNLDLKNISDKDGNIDESVVVVEDEPLMYAFQDPKTLPVNMLKGKDALIKLLKDIGFYE